MTRLLLCAGKWQHVQPDGTLSEDLFSYSELQEAVIMNSHSDGRVLAWGAPVYCPDDKRWLPLCQVPLSAHTLRLHAVAFAAICCIVSYGTR